MTEPTDKSRGPSVTLADIEANIKSEHYFTAMDGAQTRFSVNRPQPTIFDRPLPNSLSLLTFCVLILQNGFTVTGESACVSPENFDAEMGRQIARRHAVEKIWPLMGYQLRSFLAENES